MILYKSCKLYVENQSCFLLVKAVTRSAGRDPSQRGWLNTVQSIVMKWQIINVRMLCIHAAVSKGVVSERTVSIAKTVLPYRLEHKYIQVLLFAFSQYTRGIYL